VALFIVAHECAPDGHEQMKIDISCYDLEIVVKRMKQVKGEDENKVPNIKLTMYDLETLSGEQCDRLLLLVAKLSPFVKGNGDLYHSLCAIVLFKRWFSPAHFETMTSSLPAEALTAFRESFPALQEMAEMLMAVAESVPKVTLGNLS